MVILRTGSMLSSVIRACLLLLVLMVTAEHVYSRPIGIKLSEHKKIPDYDSWVPSYGTDIYWSAENSRFVLSNDTGMIEIPYQDGEFNDKESFASITGKFMIRGWTKMAGREWVADARSRTLQTSPENAYSLPVRFKGISGLSNDGKYFYLTDVVRNSLNKIEIMGRNAVVIDSWRLTQGSIRDVAWTDEGIWVCDSKVIYLYSHSMKLEGKYKLDNEIDGLAVRPGSQPGGGPAAGQAGRPGAVAAAERRDRRGQPSFRDHRGNGGGPGCRELRTPAA